MNIVRTKIVSTIGPSCSSKSMIEKMIIAGINVARINMSHYNPDFDLPSIVKRIRKASKEQNKSIAILMDLPGPKIRTSNKELITIKRGHEYTLGLDGDIPINANLKYNKLSSNAKVKIDDGKLSFKVIKKVATSKIRIKALNSGEISLRKGVNISGLDVGLPSINKKDLDYIKLAVELDVDWIALSFVQSETDRDPVDKLFKRLKKRIPLIAKIEKPEAIDRIDSIIDAFDGILIARGDLGLEMELEKVPSLQKKIIKKCNEKCKPVITATQMLESMIANPLPTRAEVNDVAGAVYDGSDAIMLSGETAVGKFPLESIRMMKSITLNVEKEIIEHDGFNRLIRTPNKNNPKKSICYSAFQMSEDLSIKVMVVMTESGDTGNTMSSFRPSSIIIGMTPKESVYRRLSLSWGILPVKVRRFRSTDQMLDFSKNFLMDNHIIKKDDMFVMTAGVPVGITGTTNMIKIETVE
jgi:pyruvate kinase